MKKDFFALLISSVSMLGLGTSLIASEESQNNEKLSTADKNALIQRLIEENRPASTKNKVEKLVHGEHGYRPEPGNQNSKGEEEKK